MTNIIAYSGGVASAYIALNYQRKLNAIVYFNDTKWEHEDLYRFNRDVENYGGFKITEDTDGRTPEQLFYDKGMLGSNRTPICSRILKAERLQKYIKSGDRVYFGIGTEEVHRAARIRSVYTPRGVNTFFPLIEEGISKNDVFKFFETQGIEIPYLYKIGFEHNNCSGGCVRAGKKSWMRLLKALPDVYAERERVESEFKEGKYTYMKDISLKELRQFENKQLDLFDDEWNGECIGICGNMI